MNTLKALKSQYMLIIVLAITSCGKHATKGAGEGATIGAASSGYLGTVYLMICGLVFLKVRFVFRHIYQMSPVWWIGALKQKPGMSSM